ASYVLPPSGLGQKLAGRLTGALGKLASRAPKVLRGAMTGAQRALAAAGQATRRVASQAAHLARKAAPNRLNRLIQKVLDPVDVATGAYFEDRCDLRLGQTLPLTFTRHHHSRSDCHGLCGLGWRDNWSDYALVSGQGSFVDIVEHTGQTYSFTFLPGDSSAYHPNYPHLTLR
ncbi:DUF6531 domain-containing protein, partial [Serratia microhaemolytica]|uniref:DUF6531 domain-containing protein n=1 Tax=Serratia microhaemolytica TaxID=2675110 RepID=UPI001F0BBCB4